ncbi:MAG: T9SS type A sorting domain-containing protein [Bacteroidia bacterium]|nr:T9SS type A sorting domain-containing protein [Bacteroidia bacterium]
MKKTLLLCFSVLSCLNQLWAQNAGDAAVQISAITQSSPAQITLNWLTNSSTSQYQVYRKLKNATFWGSPLATLSGTIGQYVDNTVSAGTNYEYRIIRTGTNYSGFGYINSGIEIAATDYRGEVILLVDSTHITALASEIKRLITDIEGDGWTVIRHDVDRNGSVYHVKSLIVDDYARDSAEIKAVFILGHVPVPYSGNINPDGHGDHLGAWPADIYYGDVDGIWTDQFVTSTTASPARTQNVPGDGKFDQSVVPSDVELQVGRVDFNNMPAFTLTEQQLLKNYLDKDHDYRKKLFVPVKRAVVDDNFGYFSGEAFAASGYKTFGAVVGTNSVSVADYITSMTGNSYLWSYGCGGGSYTSASGIGTTANLASANLQGVFTMLFGSYFGDWDSQNNFLKAPLAQGKVLTNVWAGRPHYQFHHMGLGENIGYDLLQTQNNPGGLYYASPTGITGRWIHNALMGDPTLRNNVLSPVSNVVATRIGNDCYINWSASTETNIAGYNIYVRNDSLKSYIKINSAPVAGTTYTDNCLLVKGIYSYMVRTLKLETTPSGTYYNMSEGIADTAYNTNNYAGCASFNYSLTSGNVVNLFNLSTVATTYQWDFDNGATSTATNPVVTYANNGVYNISLIATSACLVDTAYQTVVINEVGLDKLSLNKRVTLLPNPSHGKFNVSVDGSEKFSLSVMGSDGRMVFYQEAVNSGETLNLEFLAKGVYLAEIKFNGNTVTKKLLIE